MTEDRFTLDHIAEAMRSDWRKEPEKVRKMARMLESYGHATAAGDLLLKHLSVDQNRLSLIQAYMARRNPITQRLAPSEDHQA